MNEVTVVNETQIATTDYTKVATEYLQSLGNKLQQKHITQFVEICKSKQLNPFNREIYGIPYGDNFNIIVGYEVYLKRAERSGKLNGWKVEVFGENPQNRKAVITINRKDWTSPFVHEVYECEYTTGKNLWVSKPITMLKKVAMAQGFRLAFPEELGGMPYTAEELPEPEYKDVTPKPAAVEAPVELKGGPTTDAQKAEIEELLSAKTPDGKKVFTKEEIKNFLMTRKSIYTAEELIDVIKGQLIERTGM